MLIADEMLQRKNYYYYIFFFETHHINIGKLIAEYVLIFLKNFSNFEI